MATSRRKQSDLDRPMMKKQKRLFSHQTGTFVDVPEQGGVIQRTGGTLGKKKTRKPVKE